MDKKNIGQDKRQDLRIATHKPFIIKFKIEKQKGVFDLKPRKLATVQNMSVGGMSVELPDLKEEQANRIVEGKDRLILELKTPQAKKPIRIKSKIIRLEKKTKHGKAVYIAGLSFKDIKEKEREEVLHQLISICLESGCRIEY